MPRKSELLLEEAQAVSSPVRRSSRLSQTKEVAPAEQPPAAKLRNRRWSASDQEIAHTKSLRGGRAGQDVVETKTPTKPTRGRRSSITSETVDNEKSQDSKPDTKKATSKSDSSETKGTPRITRRRSASVDEGLMNENVPLTRSRRQSLEPLEVDIEAKRVTRARRSSIENLEEPEIVHTPKKTTVAKTKRRGSVTLDPIEEQTEIRKSVSPTQDAKDLSIILETSLKEEVNKSGTSSPEKMQARSSKSPVLNGETEYHKSFSPRRSTRRSASRSPVVDVNLTPKTRRSLLETSEKSDHKSEEKQNDENILDEGDTKIDPQSKTLVPNENIAKTNISDSNYQQLDNEDEENRDQVDSEKKQIGEVESTDHEITKNTLNEQKPQEIVQGKQLNDKTVAGEEATMSQSSNVSLSKSQQNDTENIEMENTDMQSQEEEKENVLAKSNSENLVDSVSPTDKISKLKEDLIEVPLQEVQVRNTRVSLGGAHRVSNVFRPKDVDFSFAEPMEVDELSMLNDTRKTNIDMSRLRDSSIDESADESFKLTLSETVCDSIGKDGSVLAGSKTKTDEEVQTKERELNVGGEAENETTQKIQLSEEQKKLLSGTKADEVGECSETYESDEYEFEVPSDDDTESNKLKTENTPCQEEEEDVKDTSDHKQPAEDKEVSIVKVNSDFIESDKSSETKEVEAEESKTDAQLHQNQPERIEANEDGAETDVQADKESETDAQLHPDQAEKVDANHSERKADENDAKKDIEIDNYHEKTTVIDNMKDEVQSQVSQMDQTLQFPQEESKNYTHLNVNRNPSEVVDLEDTGVDYKRPENCQTELDTSQAKSHKKGDLNGGCLEESKIHESPKKSEGHGSLIVNNVIDATDNSIVTLDLEKCTGEDTKLTNPTPTNDQVFEPCIDLREKLVVDIPAKLTDESPITIAKSKPNITSPKVENGSKAAKSASNNSSPSENESDWTTESSKSNDSNAKEVVEVNNSTKSAVAGNTPERRKSKRTRKLLKTVERNSTRKLNHEDSVIVVEQSECELSLSNKINKYIDCKIADILQSNSSTNDDSVFLDDKDEVMEEKISVNSSSAEESGTDTSFADSNAIKESEKSISSDNLEKQDTAEYDLDSEEEESDEENEFVETMAEEGEEDTPSEDSNAIVDEGESVGSSDSERQETDEYDSDDSFICNEEDEELLPGYEFDLECTGTNKENKRKSRIINIDNEDTDVIIIPKKEKSVKPSSQTSNESSICNEENEQFLPGYEFDFESGGANKENKRKSRIINLSNNDTDVIIMSKQEKPVKRRKVSSAVISHDPSSEEDKSDAEDAIVPQEKKENTEPTIHSKPEVSARKSSITILENVNVKDIKDPCMSERIHSLMESFTTHIKEGDISMNLSLEYNNENVLGKKVKKRKSDSSEAGEADSKKTKFEEPVVNSPKQVNNAVKKSKKKRKTSSNEDLKTQTFSLMNQLITDVKNRPKRSIKPSLTMDSSWDVQKIKAKPSISMISKKEIEDFQAKKVHPKDLRQKILYNSGRVKRVDTKTLLKKRGGI